MTEQTMPNIVCEEMNPTLVPELPSESDQGNTLCEYEPNLDSPPARLGRSTTLDVAERQRLVDCEQIIDKGIHPFLEIGQALLIIRQERLYREAYDSFEAYCDARLPFKRAHAYRLIAAARLFPLLSLAGDIVPENEWQIRPLLALPRSHAPMVWKKAMEIAQFEGGKVTQKHVKVAKEELLKELKASLLNEPSFTLLHTDIQSIPVREALILLEKLDDFIRIGQRPDLSLRLVAEIRDQLVKLA